MKKIVHCKEILTIIVLVISSCTSPQSGSDRFVGEWQSVSKTDKDTIVIKKVDADLLIFKGKNQKDTLSAIYDKENKCLRIYCISTSVISYVEKNGHLSVNQGADGEYERLTH